MSIVRSPGLMGPAEFGCAQAGLTWCCGCSISPRGGPSRDNASPATWSRVPSTRSALAGLGRWRAGGSGTGPRCTPSYTRRNGGVVIVFSWDSIQTIPRPSPRFQAIHPNRASASPRTVNSWRRAPTCNVTFRTRDAFSPDQRRCAAREPGKEGRACGIEACVGPQLRRKSQRRRGQARRQTLALVRSRQQRQGGLLSRHPDLGSHRRAFRP